MVDGLKRGGMSAEQPKKKPLPLLALKKLKYFSASGSRGNPVEFENEGLQEVVELFGSVRDWYIDFDNVKAAWGIACVGGPRICRGFSDRSLRFERPALM